MKRRYDMGNFEEHLKTHPVVITTPPVMGMMNTSKLDPTEALDEKDQLALDQTCTGSLVYPLSETMSNAMVLFSRYGKTIRQEFVISRNSRTGLMMLKSTSCASNHTIIRKHRLQPNCCEEVIHE